MNRSIKLEKRQKDERPEEKNFKKNSRKKRNIIISLILILFIISGLLFVKMGDNQLNKTLISKFAVGKEKIRAVNSNITEEDLLIGQVGYVSSAHIIERKTGTGPFDDDNEPGNDMNAENNIVRSFDQITWTIENTLSLKDLQADTDYSGGVLQVKAEFPESLVGKVKWDLDSMIWAENAEIIDGRILVAEYSLSKDKTTIPGKQNIEFILKILGAPNGLQIVPTFTVNVAGNEENEKLSLIDDDPVTVSATPGLNISIEKSIRLNCKSYFDFSTGDEALTANPNTVFGRMQGYGITLQLYNENVNKQLKGIEIPEGDITFDIDFGEFTGSSNNLITQTENEGYTPLMWDYKENMKEPITGKNGRKLKWHETVLTSYGYNLIPYNIGTDNKSCYNGGNWEIIQDTNKPYLYHVTVKNYEFDSDFKFPTDVDDGFKYSANIGCFSSGYVEAIMHFPDDLPASTIYMKAEVSNIQFKTITNTVCTEEKNISDNKLMSSINTSTIGRFTKSILYGRSGYTVDNRYADGSACIGFNKGTMLTKFYSSINNDPEDWIYGVDHLVKIDDEAIEICRTSTGVEYLLTDNEDGMAFNILYAGKKDKTGWTSDEEMTETSMDDLVYFDTIEEINDAGYICVGYLIESISGYSKSGNEFYVSVPYKVKSTAEVGKVYQATQDVRIYNEGHAPDRTWQTHLLTTNKNDYPEIKWAEENEEYIKTEYDEYGNIKPGTHYPGASVGNSLLIVQADQKITIKPVDEQGEEKSNYDIGRNENTATIKLTPTITSRTTAIIENISLILEAKIEDGVTYIPGSSNYGEPEIISNDDGTTTLKWYKNGCTANTEIEPVTFDVHISEETEHGKQYKFDATISEYVADGDKAKIGNPFSKNREASTTIQITNLTSYAIYKTTDYTAIEVNSDAGYKVTSINKTVYDLDTFQFLDVLPYNGDGRGTSFNGTYSIEKIVITNKNSEGDVIDNNSLKLYGTESLDARTSATVKDTNLGTSDIWTEYSSEEAINKELTAFALVGTLPANGTLEAEIFIKTSGNKPCDKYNNQVAAQINPLTEPVESSIVKIEVVKRTLDGKVWLDINRNGTIDDDETYLKGVKLSLKNEDNTPAKDVHGNVIEDAITDENGYYKFEDMKMGKYKVVLARDQRYEMTEKGVGSNFEINSKFNTNWETDIITKFETLESPILKQEFVNAGLIKTGGAVIVSHYIEGTTTPVPLDNGGEAEDEIMFGAIGEDYETGKTNHADYYELVAIPENSSGQFADEDIHVIYYYRLKQYPYTVNYYDKETGEKIKETKIGESKPYGTKISSSDEIVEIENYNYDSADTENITIINDETKNVINLYYTRKTGAVVTYYKDVDTEEEIADKIETEGKIGDRYTTEKQTIDGYVYVKDTQNTEGKYKEGKIEVTYYYRKQEFNLKVDKYLESVYTNGIKQNAKGYEEKDEVFKLEINKKKISECDVKVVYTIRITNDGEVAGKVSLLQEKIPQGFVFNQEDNDITWKNENGILTTDELSNVIIEPGASKDIKIVLRWQSNENNFGAKTNVVEIIKAENKFGYEEKTLKDNISQSVFVITVVTGLDGADKVILQNAIIGMILIVSMAVAVVLIWKKVKAC